MTAINSRPTWDEYFMSIAFVVATRSDDQFITHGAVLVDRRSKHIIGTGYNNTIRGFDTSSIDINNRDERRPYMQHAEKCCILNTLINPHHLPDGAIMYITGMPCPDCLQDIINFGIDEITITDRQAHIAANDVQVLQREHNTLKNRNFKINKIAIPQRCIQY